MDTLKEFFNRMHDVDFTYVVLRNWENLPRDVCLGEHSDLDILCYDFEHFKEIFPFAEAVHSYPRVRMKIPVSDSFFYCDVRHIGDGYYPEQLGRAILVQREWNPNGFFTPNPVHHRVALAYHAVHHKDYISDNYRRYLGNATVDELYKALCSSRIGWEEPSDKSVGRFHSYWKGATSIVDRENGRIKKRQTSYIGYPLIENEYKLLVSVTSKHFPEVYSINDGVLEMEDCGVSILDSVPDDWEPQLLEIVNDLANNNLQHRDIRLDNLMVKNGIIKLIDFGWAKKLDEKEEKPPPSCLGIPNRPSWGFDDAFSIRSVMKQIQYYIEEKEKP